MPAYMTKEKVQDLMTQYGGRPENTGSVEAQNQSVTGASESQQEGSFLPQIVTHHRRSTQAIAQLPG